MSREESKLKEMDLFIKIFDEGNFNWDEFEEGYYEFVYSLSVHKDKYVGDGYIDVVNVFKVNNRFFQVKYWMGGKDLDEMFNISNPVEVYPYEVTTTKYSENPNQIMENNK